MVRGVVITAACSVLAGCATLKPVAMTDCNRFGGWCAETRSMAAETYRYAQMANNAYADKVHFILADDLSPFHASVPDRNNDGDDHGFAYTIFHRKEGGRLAEIIIAFRGTQFRSGRDWWYGNFSQFQNEQGLAIYDFVRQQVDELYPETIPVNVVGHSLGGGIATFISLRRPQVNSYIFNPSPNVRKARPPVDNKRISVVERGEILKATRIFADEAKQDYYSINCKRGVRFLSDHSIRELASCLTQIAAFQDEQACRSAHRNRLDMPDRRWPSSEESIRPSC